MPTAPVFPLAIDGKPDHVLLASCLGDEDTGGGLFAFDGQALQMIDRLSSTGLSVYGNRLARLLRTTVDGPSSGEVLLYDAQGVSRYWRVDGLNDAHDILWCDAGIVAVSTGNNSIVWLSSAGDISRSWKAAGEGDAWHLNSLLWHDGRLCAAAFGRHANHRDWTKSKDQGLGIVFDVETGKNLLTGLCCPHHPRYVDGSWIVGNSAKNELVQLDAATGDCTRRVQLNGWTRGLAVCDDYLFVGESANRRDPQKNPQASIAVIGRADWKILERIVVPCREIYDLALAPVDLLTGLKRGFSTNALRAAEQEQYALFRQLGVEPRRLWATGEALAPEACRVKISSELPTMLPLGTVVELGCTVENLGTEFLVSAPPNPVHISYKWLNPLTTGPLDAEVPMRSRLARALLPRQSLQAKVAVKTPNEQGEYLLRLTLVQENVAWFDDLDASNACSGLVRVV